jgi:hypothetical protein
LVESVPLFRGIVGFLGNSPDDFQACGSDLGSVSHHLADLNRLPQPALLHKDDGDLPLLDGAGFGRRCGLEELLDLSLCKKRFDVVGADVAFAPRRLRSTWLSVMAYCVACASATNSSAASAETRSEACIARLRRFTSPAIDFWVASLIRPSLLTRGSPVPVTRTEVARSSLARTASTLSPERASLHKWAGRMTPPRPGGGAAFATAARVPVEHVHRDRP